MSESMKKSFSSEMQNLDAAGLLRTETAVVQSGDMEVRYGGDKCSLNFIGNDLLGWSSNEKIREAAKEALSKYGTGSTSSRVSIGTLDIFMMLEDKLCKFLGIEDCIVFPSNYLANLGLFEPLTNERDTIFSMKNAIQVYSMEHVCQRPVLLLINTKTMRIWNIT